MDDGHRLYGEEGEYRGRGGSAARSRTQYANRHTDTFSTRPIASMTVSLICREHAEIVETDFEAAYGILSQRLRKRSLVVLFTQVVDDVSARSVVRTVRGLGPRHLALCRCRATHVQERSRTVPEPGFVGGQGWLPGVYS